MNITPHLGNGDLLLIKMKEISNNLSIANININQQLVKEYSDNYEIKMYSAKKLIELLFPTSSISITNGPCDFYIFNNYKLKQVYLYNYIKDRIDDSIKTSVTNKYSDYIVFHTKLIDCFINEILPQLNIFLSNFKTSKTILILGEKHIGKNLETEMHKTISLYNSLLLLKNNNTVIDLTTDVLTPGNPNFDNFLYDIEIINNADFNVTFGIGGPYLLCKSFSLYNISFVPYRNISIYKDNLNEIDAVNNSLVDNMDEFIRVVNNFVTFKQFLK